jgi:osmotically-inducible protein OsmY
MMVSPISNISNQVLSALQEDPRTKDEMIDAVVNQGMVTLTGTVKSNDVREAAEQVIRRLPGVITVVNELRVK